MSGRLTEGCLEAPDALGGCDVYLGTPSVGVPTVIEGESSSLSEVTIQIGKGKSIKPSGKPRTQELKTTGLPSMEVTFFSQNIYGDDSQPRLYPTSMVFPPSLLNSTILILEIKRSIYLIILKYRHE